MSVLEIEMKASLAGVDPERLSAAAERLGFVPDYACREEDTYYNGIDRDFRETDEALRVRSHTQDGRVEACVTYKGPKQDARSQTRTELESGAASPETMRTILERLGFRKVLEVRKNRRGFCRSGMNLCLDEVDGLGRFLELEIVAPDGTEGAQREALLERRFTVLDELGVPRENLTRSSYLELLMARATSKKSDQGV